MKKILFLLFVLTGCTKTEITQPTKNNKMGLPSTIILTQTGSSNQMLYNDMAGYWSSGNLSGWDVTGVNNIAPLTVTNVAITGGTFRAAPSSAAPVTFPSTAIAPSSQYSLPYVVWQQYTLFPANFGFTAPTFQDGLYQPIVSITYNSSYEISDGSVDLGVYFTIGDIITDVTSGHVIGVVIAHPHNITLGNLTGYTVAVGDVITNGTNTITLGSSTIGLFSTSTYNVTVVPCWLTVNLKCCYGNLMRKLCSCNCPNPALDRLRNNILLSIQESQCYQYNSALDTMYTAQLYCNSNNCGC